MAIDLNLTSATTTNKSNIDFYDTASYSENSNINDFYKIPKKDVDGVVGGKNEIIWVPEWTKWHGIYRKVGEFGAMIDTLINWALGKGWKTKNKNTEKALDKIKGMGKDSANTVLSNIARKALICGDGFGEIVRDKANRITNIKPLNPGNTEIVVSDNGILKEYRQISTNPIRKVHHTWKPNEIFHLCWNRIADEIHGIPYGERMEDFINMKNEAQKDLKVVFHRYVKPLVFYHVNTDDDDEIAQFKATLNNSYKSGENIILPSETIEKIDRVSIPQYSTLDPLPWIQHLIRQLVTTGGVPEIVMGWGEQTTEASAKIIHISYEQTIEKLQKWIEENMKIQLNMDIELEFPASLIEELKNDEKKDSNINKERKSEITPTKP